MEFIATPSQLQYLPGTKPSVPPKSSTSPLPDLLFLKNFQLTLTNFPTMFLPLPTDHCSLGTSSEFTEAQRHVRRSFSEGGNTCSIDAMMNRRECEACQ